MIKVGILIGDRYEIIEKIGTGGMSDVYRAKDHKLNRHVAVKVLKQEFSENANFVAKFRSEAQAAAGLMHPNIVNVYDVGEEDSVYYIVMELVEGITLKKYIEKKARLSFKEAVSIAIQVSMGIEAAHNNHIIHRDIKPQNIIISKDGKVKVTDFGIAKAATSNTITSNVMGSVHYTSPEQARGGYSDAKSDIYSLGVTIFEMLTGRVPFNGETTVAIAIKHIQDEMPSPRDFVPEIPISVEQIVMKCTQKSPDRRYQSAAELIEDLKKSLISPDENFVKIDTEGSNAATRMITDDDMNNVKHQTSQREYYDTQTGGAYVDDRIEEDEDNYYRPAKKSVSQNTGNMKKKNGSGGKNAGSNRNTGPIRGTGQSRNTGPIKVSNGKKGSQAKGKKGKQDEPKMETITTVMIVVIATVIALIFILVIGNALDVFSFDFFQSGQNTESSEEQVSMPDVVGQNVTDVSNSLRELGLVVEVEYKETDDFETDIVIGASESVGAMIAKGSTVTLSVSAGKEGTEVPNVVGRSSAEATATLEKDGFKVTKSEASSEEVEKGDVISQMPEAGTKASLGAAVSIVISIGKEETTGEMPDLLGKTEEAAKTALEEAGFLNITVTEVPNDTYPEGQICYQNYTAGQTIDVKNGIELRLSSGPEIVNYSCALSVEAPVNYEGGAATVILKNTEGTELWRSESINSFPVAINLSNFTSTGDYGTVTTVYWISVPSQVTNADGTVSTGTTQEITSVDQIVTFTQVQ